MSTSLTTRITPLPVTARPAVLLDGDEVTLGPVAGEPEAAVYHQLHDRGGNARHGLIVGASGTGGSNLATLIVGGAIEAGTAVWAVGAQNLFIEHTAVCPVNEEDWPRLVAETLDQRASSTGYPPLLVFLEDAAQLLHDSVAQQVLARLIEDGPALNVAVLIALKIADLPSFGPNPELSATIRTTLLAGPNVYVTYTNNGLNSAVLGLDAFRLLPQIPGMAIQRDPLRDRGVDIAFRAYYGQHTEEPDPALQLPAPGDCVIDDLPRERWYARLSTWLAFVSVLGTLRAVVSGTNLTGFLITAVLYAAGATGLWHFLNYRYGEKTEHQHCDFCDRCSSLALHRTATKPAGDMDLDHAGWRSDTDGEMHCPACTT